MKQIFLHIIMAMLGLQTWAQEITVCYEYKIQYNHESKDSSQMLVGRKYYNDRMLALREVVLGPEKKDSCSTQWIYDKFSNLIRELTKCSDNRISSLLNHQYAYRENREIKTDTFTQYKPFYGFAITEYKKDSTVKIFYESKKKKISGVFEYKDVDIYNPAGKVIFTFSIDNKEDTLMSHGYSYFPLTDTTKVRSNPQEYINSKANSVNVDIIYLNTFNEDEIVDYYRQNKYQGSLIKKYDPSRKPVHEQYYDKTKDKIISEKRYTYNEQGILVEKTDTNLEDQLTKNYIYNSNRMVREEYIYGGLLDHAIVYVYKSLKVSSQGKK
jgi:hypothetical protein